MAFNMLPEVSRWEYEGSLVGVEDFQTCIAHLACAVEGLGNFGDIAVEHKTLAVFGGEVERRLTVGVNGGSIGADILARVEGYCDLGIVAGSFLGAYMMACPGVEDGSDLVGGFCNVELWGGLLH